MPRNALFLVAVLLAACDTSTAPGGADGVDGGASADGAIIVPVETDVPSCSSDPGSPCAQDVATTDSSTVKGDPAPGFTLTDANTNSATYGEPVSLADYAGSVVVVYFAYST